MLITVQAMTPENNLLVEGTAPLVFVGKTRHNFILLPSETYDVVLSATMLVPGLVNCNVFDVDASPLYFQPLCSVYTGMPKEAYIEEVVRQHSQAVGNTAEGTVTASHRTCEAVTRLRRGLHGEGKEKTHFFLDLIPLGFHRSQLVIEGRQELVFTNVVFAHANDTQCRAAAEERIAKKREVYKKDYNAFEKNYSQFMELERIRLEEEGNFSTLLMESNNPNNNSVTASKLTAPTGGAFMEYIYRPPVQVSYVKSKEKKDDAKPSNEKSVSPSGNDDDEEGIRQASTAEIQNDVKNISSPPNIIFAAEEEGFGLADKKKDKKGHSPLVHPNEPIVPLVAFSSSASKKVDTYAYTSMSPQEYFQRQRTEPHRLIAYEEGNNEVSKVSNVFLASNSSGTFSKSDAKGTSFPSDSSALRRATLLAPLAPPPATEGDAHVTGQFVLSPILGEARKTFVDIDDDEEDERIGGLDDDNEDLKNSEEQAESSVRETIRPTMRSTTTKNNNLLDELFSDANQNSTLQDAVDLDLDDPLTPTVKAPVDNNNTNKALFSSVMTSTPVPLQSKETLTNNGKYYSNISKVKKSTFSSSSSSSGVD
ncbi:hypothetical protein AGDE_13548 [Angomonas deanei]|nr:hypothetical protein AGDE_13548 [Angomonas deanei]|eukprot:EPY22212.1 hypothetical protein AGDE_13548 [Angomonas deanei]